MSDGGRFPPPSPEERLDLPEERLDLEDQLDLPEDGLDVPEEGLDVPEDRSGLPEGRLDLAAGGPPPPAAEDRAELTRQWPAIVPWVVILAALVIGWAVFLR